MRRRLVWLQGGERPPTQFRLRITIGLQANTASFEEISEITIEGSSFLSDASFDLLGAESDSSESGTPEWTVTANSNESMAAEAIVRTSDVPGERKVTSGNLTRNIYFLASSPQTVSFVISASKTGPISGLINDSLGVTIDPQRFDPTQNAFVFAGSRRQVILATTSPTLATSLSGVITLVPSS
jgi:hypothetical protein